MSNKRQHWARAGKGNFFSSMMNSISPKMYCREFKSESNAASNGNKNATISLMGNIVQ